MRAAGRGLGVLAAAVAVAGCGAVEDPELAVGGTAPAEVVVAPEAEGDEVVVVVLRLDGHAVGGQDLVQVRLRRDEVLCDDGTPADAGAVAVGDEVAVERADGGVVERLVPVAIEGARLEVDCG